MKLKFSLKGLRTRAIVCFIQIILIILKLANVLNWSWVWIFAPTWILILLILLATIYAINQIIK